MCKVTDKLETDMWGAIRFYIGWIIWTMVNDVGEQET